MKTVKNKTDMPLFLLFFLLLVLLPDLYIWSAFLRGAVPPLWSVAYWLVPGFCIAATALWITGHAGNWVIRPVIFLLLCVTLPKLLFTLLSLAGRAVGLLTPHAAAAGNWAGIAGGVLLALVFCYGCVRGWKRLELHEEEIRFADLPAAFDGYRIVHLSDLHVGTFGRNGAFLRRLVGRIDALRPDLILFTGDIVNVSAGELAPHTEILSRLQAPDGVYSVLGNHDYCEYGRYDTPDGAARNAAEVIRMEREMGWRLLRNEHRVLRRGGDSIVLAGVENIGRPPFPSRGDLRRALDGVPEGAFTILMSHDPSHWRREVLPASGVQLTLAGHTHAMQFRIGGFSPSAWSYPEWGGLYREGGRRLFVSTGAGGSVPFRLGAWPEIVLLTLRRGSPE